MAKSREEDMFAEIVRKAKEFGACLAGIADVEALKRSPSHLIYGKLGEYKGVGTKEANKTNRGEVVWPENAKSAIVIVVEHPEDRPELDWWKAGYSGGTAGNRILMSINDKLAEWLGVEKGIDTIKMPYHIEDGGIFLKDAAVMAGLGCIGKNNILVTPRFGPRVRLRAMLTDEVLPHTGPIDFDPCLDCGMPCRNTCPQEAFNSNIYLEKDFGLDELPARTGAFSRHICNVQMKLDIAKMKDVRAEGQGEPEDSIQFCRICELACPVGKAG